MFRHIHTTEELKKAFHKAVKEAHPDHGGTAEQFKAVKKAYDEAAERIAREEANAGKHKHADGTAKTAEEILEEQQEFAVVLEKVLNLDGLQIEVCGSWLWITGNTYEWKSQLKEAGMKFANKKKAWYWHAGEWVRRYKKHFTLEEIRDMHGSNVLQGNAVPRLTA